MRTLLGAILSTCAEDPLTPPETEAEIAFLTRYLAAAEMAICRTIRILRELQTTCLFRLEDR